jgi:hypothetical protein
MGWDESLFALVVLSNMELFICWFELLRLLREFMFIGAMLFDVFILLLIGGLMLIDEVFSLLILVSLY